MGDFMEMVKVSVSREYIVNIGTGFLDTIGEKIREIKRVYFVKIALYLSAI